MSMLTYLGNTASTTNGATIATTDSSTVIPTSNVNCYFLLLGKFLIAAFFTDFRTPTYTNELP